MTPEVPTWHLIGGEDGCRFARERGAVAVIVDALRASSTAAHVLAAGAAEIWAVSTVETARAAKRACPEALLFGERGGLPPEGFDYGNSPGDAAAARGRTVIFSTTTGTQRILQAGGAAAVLMRAAVNARAAAHAAQVLAEGYSAEIVVIPAGLAGAPEFPAEEDWAAAAAILLQADGGVAEGAAAYREWRHLLELDGLERLFDTATHAQALREVGLGDDVGLCARLNTVDAVPIVIGKNDYGAIIRSF
ncbi:MAG: 2-phosphosulfolactate phosphatase [Candidatus Hydrogenedentales bacterium]